MSTENTGMTRVYGRGGGRSIPEMRELLDRWRAGSPDGDGSLESIAAVAIKDGGLALRGGANAFVQAGSVTWRGWAGFDVTVDVDVRAEPSPHTVVSGLHIQLSDGGAPDITAQALQKARLGEAMRRSIIELTLAERPEQHVVTARRSGAVRGERRDKRSAGLTREYERTAELWHEATAAGAPTHAAVTRGLAEMLGVDERDIDPQLRIRQARKRGLIPPHSNKKGRS